MVSATLSPTWNQSDRSDCRILNLLNVERINNEVAAVSIQIYGRSKCFDARKAERYFKERKIKFQSIDIDRYGLSKGELASVKAAIGIDNLMDIDGKEYERLNLKYINTGETREEMLLNNSRLYVSPIVRNGKQATIGYKPDVWKNWK
jgi:arsenate reductase-like glutaredoxin family protein